MHFVRGWHFLCRKENTIRFSEMRVMLALFDIIVLEELSWVNPVKSLNSMYPLMIAVFTTILSSAVLVDFRNWLEIEYKIALLIYFLNFFYLKAHCFRSIMENNFIQMAVSAGHAVAYTISPIFKNIIDCSCISPMASRILFNKASIVSGLSA